MMARIILFIIALSFIIGCTTTYNMSNSYVQYLNPKQLDSLCIVENIPYIGDKWLQGVVLHDNEKEIITQYSYTQIKPLAKGSKEITYTCVYLDSLYRINKRILISTKKVN